MLEPARLGKPVLFGPHTENFREAAALLAAGGGGLIVSDAASWRHGCVALLADEVERRRMGSWRSCVISRQGAVRRRSTWSVLL